MSTQRPPVPTSQAQQDKWQSSGWYHALSLTERADLYRASSYRSSTASAAEEERAIRRLHEWKTQRPFTQGTLFAERLAQDALSEDDLLRLLAEPVATLQDAYLRTSSPPEWLTTLQQAFDTPAQYRDEIEWPLQHMGKSTVALTSYLQPLLPLLKYGFNQLHTEMQKLHQHYKTLPFDPQHVIQLFSAPLAEQILIRLSKVFVLEMHVARIQGELQGETAEARFQSFVHQLSQKERILALLEEYPILARQLVVTLNHWVTFTREFVTHLCADWHQICALFAPEQDPGPLVNIHCGAGDVHHEGRSVIILTFQSGLQLLYKPRSLAIDVHFQQLLSWLNEQGAQPTFRTIAVIDQGDYGWSEFVSAQSCVSENEVARFYERQGSYLALLYALNAIDIHAENVIAAGEHPMLVDLEALFHQEIGNVDATQPFQIGQHSINNSVFRIGLLPCRIWSSKGAQGIDLSGMGGQEGQISPFKSPRWEGLGTDQMRLVRQQSEIAAGQNRPKLNGEHVEVLAYRASLLSGFTKMYRLLQDRCEALLTEILPLFAQDEIRLLFRPSQRYANLLLESFHPDLFRDAVERERFFDQLWREVEVRPFLAKILPTERRELLRGDIPLFKTSPASRAIFTSAGESLGPFFDISSLDLVKQRLQSLDEQDLTRQCWIIEAALSTLLVGPERVTGKALEMKPARKLASSADLTQAALAIGDRLETLAVRNATGASWLGVSAVSDTTWSLLPTDTNLYDGTSGIALFLGYLGTLTGQARYTELAQLSLRAVHTQVEQQKERIQEASIGTFTGLGSALYLMTHMGALWQDASLLQEAEALAELLIPLIAQDTQLDIVSGAAGCILNLLGLYTLRPGARLLEIACLCGDHLLSTAQAMDAGIGWITIASEKPLGGFAHGASGIVLSLLKLAHISGCERYRKAALDGLTYDRSLYVPSEQNWADLRTFAARLARTKQSSPEQENQQPCMIAWCHGAAGIGLGRTGGLAYLDDELTRQEIETAINTTIAKGFRDNHSLCHGALGNLDLLLTAAQTLNIPRYHTLLAEFTAILLESITACGWVAGVPLGIETPGLMTGLAGMGYELLRLAEPEKVPSILLVEPPRR
ncbi:MAG TPA: type 2 lanthipeptide synthetase LanM family protein [Ktedonobacteraceae bacterium]|nr:type 2 lanthipeptide synthetase LanM family protein [Ktedonobacteraceae bacterium]